MPTPDKIDQLYDALKADGAVSKSRENFRSYMLASGDQGYRNRKQLYDALKADGAVESATYEEFRDRLGLHAVKPQQPMAKPSSTPQSVQPPQKPQPKQQKATQQPKKTAWKPTPAQQMQFQQTINSAQQTIQNVNERHKNMVEYSKQRMKRPFGQPVELAFGAKNEGALAPFDSKNLVQGREEYNPKTGKLEPTYITSAGNKYNSRIIANSEQRQIDDAMERELYPIETQLRDAYAERERLNKLAQERVDELEKSHEELPWYLQLGEYANSDKMPDAGSPMHRWDNDVQYKQYMAALRKNRALITTLEDKKSGKMNEFWHSLGNEITNGYTFSLAGKAQLDDMSALTFAQKHVDAINRKRQKGEALTKEEQAAEAVLKNAEWDNRVQSQYGDEYGAWARAGKMGAVSLDLMMDFALMGGQPLSLAKSIAGGTGKLATKLVGNAATKGFGKFMVKTTGATLGSMVAGAEIANTVGVGRTMSDAAGRYQGDIILDENGDYVFGHFEDDGKGGQKFVKGGDSFIGAVLGAERTAIAENGSEIAGAFLPGGKVLLKGLEKIGLSKIASGLTSLSGRQWYTAYSRALQTAGFNGVPGEALEEYVGTGFDALMGGEEWKSLADKRTHVDIWLGCATMGALLNAPRIVGTGYQMAQYYRYKHNTDKSDRLAETRLGNEVWEPLRQQIDEATNGQITDVLVNVLDNENLDGEQKKAVAEYAANLQRMRGYSLGRVSSEERDDEHQPTQRELDEQTLEQSYTQGYGATDIADMQDIKHGMDYQHERVASFADANLMSVLDGSPMDAIDAIRSNEQLSDEQKQIAIDYVNARNTHNALLQRINDDADVLAEEDRELFKQIQHKTDGSLRPAVLKEKDSKGNDQQVYIVDGNVQMMPDGSMVDKASSDNIVVVYNPVTGERKQIDPSADTGISTLGETFTAEDYEAGIEQKRQNYVKTMMDDVNGIIRPEVGQQVVYNGEPITVTSVFSDGGIIASREDGTIIVASHEELQQEADKISYADYLQRNRNEVEQADTNTSIPVTDTQKTVVNGAPTEYNEGMELTIRDEDGEEKPAKVIGMFRMEATGPVADADGKLVGFLIDGEPHFEHVTKLGDKVVNHTEERAVPTEMPQYSLDDDVYLQTEDGVIHGNVIAEENPDGLITIQSEQPIGGRIVNQFTREQLEGMTGNNAVENISQQVNISGENIPQEPIEAPVTPSEAPAQPTEQPTTEPMPMIGEGEDAEPDFAATTPQRAHDYIFNESGLDEADATEFTKNNLDAANKELEKIKTRKPKMGTSIAKFNKDKAEWERKVNEAQAKADYWNQVKAARDKVLADRLAEQQERERQQIEQAQADEAAYREEMAKKEAEQAALGTNTVSPAIREKWASAPKIEGAHDEIVLPNGEKIAGRYYLVESGAASASHDSNNGFAKTEGFPVDGNGGSVNDRDYERDMDAQQVTRDIANNYDSRAVQTPVVVSQDGVVLSGNGRTMAGELAAAQNTDAAYNSHIAHYPTKWGFTKQQVEGMQHPRIVFVPDAAMPYTAETFAKFNQQEMKGQSKTEQAVKLGKVVSDKAFNRIIGIINRFDTLGDFYADAKATSDAISELQGDGVLSQAQMAEMYDGDGISAIGKELLENTLIGKAFESNPNAVREITEFKSMRQSIITALAEISNNLSLGKDYSLESELAQAIDLVYQARNSGIKFGEPVSWFARQMNLDFFGLNDTVADYNNATMLMIADIINDNRSSRLKKYIQIYNHNAQDSANGQLDLFTGSVQSKEDIINEVKHLFNNGSEEEQQKAAQEAVARRKAESVQENGTVANGSEGSNEDNDRVEETPAEQAPTEEDGSKPVMSHDEKITFMRQFLEDTAGDMRLLDVVTDEEVQKLIDLYDAWEVVNDGLGAAHEANDALLNDKNKAIAQKAKKNIETAENAAKAAFAPVEDYYNELLNTHNIEDEEGDVDEAETPSAETPLSDAISAAEEETDQNPTEAQKEAGNYKKGHVRIDGYDVTIENPKGSVRRGTDASGKQWEQEMHNTYGYIRGTEGVDGDHIDVFFSEDPSQGDVFVVDQVNKDGSFDEHKVMYGFPDIESARKAYLSNYEDGWQGLGAITPVSKEEFKKWVDSSHRKTKPFAEYSSVKPLGDTQLGEQPNKPTVKASEDYVSAAERIARENEVKRTAAHFAEETQEEAEAFDKRVPEMDDVELLAYMQEDGRGDLNKAYHPSVYDEYDYRHSDEQLQSYDDTLVRLNESGTTLEQAEEMLANMQKGVSRLATYDRAMLLGQEQALQEYIAGLEKEGERDVAIPSQQTEQKESDTTSSTIKENGRLSELRTKNAQGSGKKNSSDGKIDDVGEVLAGARKDMRKEIAKSLANVTEAALVEKPFGKVYKKPDLKKAVESGALREKDAIFYEALFSMVNQQKPKVTQSEMRSKRYIPDHKTKAERWAADTFKQMEVLRQFMELDEPGRDAMMERVLADRYPTREQELAEIEKRKGWNPDYEGHKYEWGEMTTPNPLWVTHEVMNRLGYSVGDKLDVPYGMVKANMSGTGYSIVNLKGERASLFGSGMTLDEAIDRIVYLAKLKRGDADVSHPTQLFAFPSTKSESGESGRYRVMWGRDYKTREFDSKDEADAFAQTKSGAYVSPIMETKRRFGYKVRFTHPLTGEKMFVDDAEFDTKEEAQAYFDGNFEKLNEATNAKLQEEREKKGEKKTLTADDVVHVAMVHSGKGGWTHAVVIDKKYANNDGQVRIIKEGFASRKDAKSFADSVKDDVLKTVLKHKEDAKKIVYFDTGENSRIGEDYRNGKNVDAEDFMNTFGFRGVQFGNWTNQADRQMAVNQAYDAFMDMSRLIGVSPKAMSLNGELGIAFGARGVGGFAAHYEPGEVVINLTKTQGAGSLAHEWWHALDNYFARRAGSAGDMVTDNRRIEMRGALRKAFNDMLDLVNGSDYAQRSAAKGEYWGRTHEITARLLAEWVDRELKKRGELNTFLSRGAVVERGQQHNYNVYEVLERLAGREPMPFEEYKELPESLKGIPYPSAKEVEQFGGSLRHIFDTLEENVDEETGNVMLYEPTVTYETRDGKKVVWRSLFDEMSVRGEDETTETSLQNGEARNTKSFNPSELRMRKLKNGETCHVERVYEETKQFDFTGKEKVESAEDVAYIFRQLENAAVENSFLVLVKDGRPTVIHLGVGSYIGVMAPYEQALVAYSELKPDQVYFVHNHPSGTLKASRQDQDMLNRMKRAFGEDVVQQGIIIDTTSGNYGEFESIETADETYSVEEEMPQSQGDEVPIKVYQFSRQVFAPDWNPESAFKIVSSQSVAEFVSSHRLGEHKKMSFLVVSNNGNVVANVFLPWTKLSDVKSGRDAGDLLAGYVHQCGGVRGVLYGNYDYEPDDRVVLASVGGRMRQLNAPLMDALHVEHSAYESGWSGVGETKEGYGVDATPFHNVIDELFGNENFDKSEHARERYDLAATPEWMKNVGISGERFTLSFKNIKTHLGKDADHNLTAKEWHKLPSALKHPFLVTSYGNEDGKFRLYTTIKVGDKFAVVGVDVVRVNQGKGVPMLELNRIKTVFGRDRYVVENGERILAWDKNITPEQEALLRGHNYREYPTIQELSAANVGNNSETQAQNDENFSEDTVRYRIREDEPPIKTQKVYKLMRLGKDGKLYPLFIDAAAPTELGVWYNADSPNLDILQKMPSGTYLVDYENETYTSLEDYAKEHGFKAGKFPPKDAINEATAKGLRWVQIEDTEKGQRRYGGESRKYWNLGINGSGSVSTFAMRPGWHAGSLPSMRQIGKGKDRNLRDDSFVWVEGEVSADVNYQQEADRNPDKDIPTHIPENGYYLKATNANATASQADRIGWYVAGAFKPNRIISDAEAKSIIDEYNAQHPDGPVEYDFERESGKPFTEEQAQDANERNAGRNRDGENELSQQNSRVYTAKERREREAYAERQWRRAHEVANEIIDKLNVSDDITVYESIDEVPGSAKFSAKRRRAKGWYDPRTNKIVVVLGNHRSPNDVLQTILHEAVAHYGLRKLFGKNFDVFLDNVYKHADKEVRSRIISMASNKGWDIREATEEYLASLAEDTDFDNVESSSWAGHWFNKIKQLFLDMLHHIGLRDYDGVRLSDNELRYILWRSYKNLAEPGHYRNYFSIAEDTVMQSNLHVGYFTEETGQTIEQSTKVAENGLMFRDGDFSPRDRAVARDEYERMVSSGSYQFQEAVQDSMLGLKRLYQSILGRGTRMEDVDGFENAYLAENRMSSVNAAEQHEYYVRYMKPLLKAISDIVGSNNDKRLELTDYMMAKHGLERNVVMAQRDFDAYQQKYPNGTKTLVDFRERDYAGLTALTGEDDVAMAELAAQQMVDTYEQDHDTSELWQLVNDATSATLAKIYNSGLLSKERYEQIQKMFEYYIPLQGWDETTSDEVYGYLTSKNGPLSGSPIKHAKGRSSKADDPIATLALMADDAIRQGNRNVMKQTFLNFVLNHQSDLVSVNDLWLQYNAVMDEWEPVFADIENTDTPADVERKVKAFEERMQQLAESDPDNYKRGRDAQNIPYKVVKDNLKEHQVLVRRNGRTYVLTINGNPRAAQALNGLTNPDVETGGVVGNLMQGAQWLNRNLSAFYTTRNPDFVASNFLRDMLYSNCMTWVKESPKYALRFHKNFGRVNPAHMRILLGKWENGTLDESNYIENLFKQFMLNGGETGYTNIKDIDGHKREIASELKRNGSNARKAWQWLGEQLDLLNGSAENCARFAAFVTSREEGRSIERSIYDAKEISVNFNKKGSGGKMVNATGQTLLGKVGSYVGGGGRLLYVFWNAGVQGATNFARAAKRNPKKATAGAASMFMLGAVIPLLAQAMGGDDDDDKNAYYNLPEYVRRSNIIINAGNQWIAIPLPIEFRAFYGLGELATGVITGNERYSDSELAFQMGSQISQILPLDMLEGGGGINPFVPSIAKPFVEAYIMNKSWTGLPVYKDSPWNKNNPEWTKAYKSANTYLVSGTKWLNEISGGDDYKKGFIDINPAKVEYLLSGMFGGGFTTGDKLVKMGETIFGDREFDWRNMLIANRVVKTGDERTANRKLSNEYFKYKDEYEETKRLLKKYSDEAATNERYKHRLERLQHSEEYLLYDVFDNYQPILKNLNDAKDGADEATLKSIENEENTLRRDMVDLMHAIEDDEKPDINAHVDAMLKREFEAGGRTQKPAGSRIAKRLGGTDSYGSPQNEYGQVYLQMRDYVDLAEDVMLQVALKNAKDSGDTDRAKDIESARRQITEVKKDLTEVPYTLSDGTEITAKDIMQELRDLRKNLLSELGITTNAATQ